MSSSLDPTYNEMSSVGTNALWFGFAALVLASVRIFGRSPLDDSMVGRACCRFGGFVGLMA